MNKYEEQAEQFLKETNTTIKAAFLKYDYYFDGDDSKRNVYRITLKREGVGQYTFKFGSSIMDSKDNIKPCSYDVLACITKYDPGSFVDFCSDYGYDEDSREAEKTYKAVVKEWENVSRLFSDVMEQLQEIN